MEWFSGSKRAVKLRHVDETDFFLGHDDRLVPTGSLLWFNVPFCTFHTAFWPKRWAVLRSKVFKNVLEQASFLQMCIVIGLFPAQFARICSLNPAESIYGPKLEPKNAQNGQFPSCWCAPKTGVKCQKNVSFLVEKFLFPISWRKEPIVSHSFCAGVAQKTVTLLRGGV